MSTVVKRYDILKSPDVEKDQGHDHKLWWVDIEKNPAGQYQVVTYAQLFRINYDSIEGDHIRRYDVGKPFSTLEKAEADAMRRIRTKKSAYKQYEFFQDRSIDDIDITEEAVKRFLQKYGNLKVSYVEREESI